LISNGVKSIRISFGKKKSKYFRYYQQEQEIWLLAKQMQKKIVGLDISTGMLEVSIQIKNNLDKVVIW
jgi:hypothetical protein